MLDCDVFYVESWGGTALRPLIAAAPLYIPTSDTRGCQFLYILANTSFRVLFLLFLHNSHPRCEAISHGEALRLDGWFFDSTPVLLNMLLLKE